MWPLICLPILLAWLASKPTGRRFLSGQHLDGKRRSDGTFLHRGRNSLDVSGFVSPWAKLAGWERTSYRLAGIIAPPTFLVGFQQAPVFTVAFTGTLTAAAAAHPAQKAVRALRLQRHNATITRPLADALTDVVRQDRGIRPTEWVDVPLDYRTSNVTITLPAKFGGTEPEQERVTAIAAGKLGGEWEPAFNMQGYEPTLTLTHSPAPPDFVGWPDLEPHLGAADEAQPVIGLGSRRAPVALDFASETPHVLVSVPSGGGKSVTARIIGAHVLHHGGQLLILDYKRISQSWADGLPGVTYARTAEEIHAALLGLQSEIALRYENADGDLEPSSVFNDAVYPSGKNGGARRLLVIVEELNVTGDLLQNHWLQLPSSVRRGLHNSPARKALHDLLFMGRQARVNALVMAQKGTAAAFGGQQGAAARENTTPIIGGNSSANTWAMLAPDATPPPRSTTPGRMHTITGDTVKAVQVGYLTDQQARLWATSGVEPPAATEPAPTFGGFA